MDNTEMLFTIAIIIWMFSPTLCRIARAIATGEDLPGDNAD